VEHHYHYGCRQINGENKPHKKPHRPHKQAKLFGTHCLQPLFNPISGRSNSSIFNPSISNSETIKHQHKPIPTFQVNRVNPKQKSVLQTDFWFSTKIYIQKSPVEQKPPNGGDRQRRMKKERRIATIPSTTGEADDRASSVTGEVDDGLRSVTGEEIRVTA